MIAGRPTIPDNMNRSSRRINAVLLMSSLTRATRPGARPAAPLLYGLALVILAHGWANAANIAEGGNKLALGYEINRTYAIPLGLKGKSAAHALSVLLSEGFRCDVKPRRKFGPDDEPLSDCTRKPSGFGPLCDE